MSARDTRTDHELVDAYAAGDTDAVGVLFARHRQYVLRTARFYTGGRSLIDPDDVCGEVALRLVTAVTTWDGRCAFTTWLHTVTRNAVIDRSRREGKVPRDLRADVPDLAGPDTVDVGDASGLRALLERLPAHQRDVVALVDGADLDVAAAARVLGVPLGTAKSRRHRGLAALRTAATAAGLSA